jgi:hypothetical protein
MKTEGILYNKLGSGAVRCHLCAHRCKIEVGETGFCRVRVNDNGTLYTLAFGETVARKVDPIEKKPLYHFLPGSLSRSIAYMKQLGIWVEVTTLVIPGENDGDADLKGIAGFIAGVDREIPWHIIRFHPDYRFGSHSPTPAETLERAERIGREAGLEYVNLGNVGGLMDTRCPACGNPVVQRSMSGVRAMNLDDGKCRHCGAAVAGRWRP